jgi:hypothetical protein
MASSTQNDKKTKEHFTFFDNVKDKLTNPLVIGGILVIIILIVVAIVMWQKHNKAGAQLTETATKYLLTNTPDLSGYN